MSSQVAPNSSQAATNSHISTPDARANQRQRLASASEGTGRPDVSGGVERVEITGTMNTRIMTAEVGAHLPGLSCHSPHLSVHLSVHATVPVLQIPCKRHAYCLTMPEVRA